MSESGSVRVSSNPKVLPSPIGVATAGEVLAALRTAGAHQFLADDVSLTDRDVPDVDGDRQVTDAHLLALARRRGVRLVTFDHGIATLADAQDV